MSDINDGGAAFPRAHSAYSFPQNGMSLRDYFAAHVQADDRLVKAVRAMDDTALYIFALHPDFEREESITETEWLNGLPCYSAMSEIEKIVTRLELEAKAIARVRFIQADAMLKARGES